MICNKYIVEIVQMVSPDKIITFLGLKEMPVKAADKYIPKRNTISNSNMSIHQPFEKYMKNKHP